MKKLFSFAMALLLAVSLPVSVLADTWYLEDGSITVTATDGLQTVIQDGITTSDSAPVITQRDSSTPTTNTVTIKAEDATASVTIQDVNIVKNDLGDGTVKAAVTIDVADNASANVTLDGVNIDVSGTGNLPEWCGEAAVQITGKGDVTLELDGENTVRSGLCRAGVEKDDANSSGNLTITDETGTNGSLNATGGEWGSGIGGGGDPGMIYPTNLSGHASNITISGGTVEAQGGNGGSGIGGGGGGDGSSITISGGTVEAQGGDYGSGIGGGYFGDGSSITISGGTVEAQGGSTGSGIGGGYFGDGSDITVSGDAQVKAQGGESVVDPSAPNATGAGAAIGNGGRYLYGTTDPESLKGAEVTPDTIDLDEGWIGTYTPGAIIFSDPYQHDPGANMDTDSPERLTYKDANDTVQTATENITPVAAKAPTCTEDGHEAGFLVDGVLVAVTIPATEHNVPDGYTPKNNATCTTLGTMEGYCVNCKTMVTVLDPDSTLKDHTFTTYVPDPENLATCTKAGTKTAVCDVCHEATDTVIDPAKDHSFTNYVSNPDAKCGIDGTKTALCDHGCGKTDTIPDVGSALEHSFTNYISDGNATYTQDGTKTAACDNGCGLTDTIPDPGSRIPYYQVKGQNGQWLSGQEERKDGVLTITVDADTACLTGTMGGIEALSAQGIHTIVFVTNRATSTFALSDLLAQGSGSYTLTHDGETVTFTAGKQQTDVTGILRKS